MDAPKMDVHEAMDAYKNAMEREEAAQDELNWAIGIGLDAVKAAEESPSKKAQAVLEKKTKAVDKLSLKLTARETETNRVFALLQAAEAWRRPGNRPRLAKV